MHGAGGGGLNHRAVLPGTQRPAVLPWRGVMRSQDGPGCSDGLGNGMWGGCLQRRNVISSTASCRVEPREQLKCSWRRLRGGGGLDLSPSDFFRREAASFLVGAIFLIPRGVLKCCGKQRLGLQVTCRVSSFLHALIWVFSRSGQGHALPSSEKENTTLQLFLPKTKLTISLGGTVC